MDVCGVFYSFEVGELFWYLVLHGWVMDGVA